MRRPIAVAIALGVAICLCTSALGSDFSLVREPAVYTPPADETIKGVDDTYAGTLRIYVVESRSREEDSSGDPYLEGFIGFAEVTAISLEEGEYYYSEADFAEGGLDEHNVHIIAVLFNGTGYQQDAYPPNGYYFTAYYNDMAVLAELDELTFAPEPTSPYTHDIFIEEGTATW